MANVQEPTAEGTRILLVEDEESLAIGLEYNLIEEGYEVVRARDGAEALNLYDPEEIDLVILDLMLPRVDGFAVAEKIRVSSPQVPILMLTARTAAADRIRGLESGADDYLTKPFHLRELLLRVGGMLKRKMWYRSLLEASTTYQFGNNTIDFASLTGHSGEREIRMTPLEAMLLRYFIQHKERVVSRKELLENVWQTASEVETRTVDNFIMRLRKHFEQDPAHPAFLRNIRGAGYLFTPNPKATNRTL